jgi:predicted O-methyltransferase YrrM
MTGRKWNRLFVLGPAGFRRFPIDARHSELSVLSSPDDAPGRPTPALLDLALNAVRGALNIDLSPLHGRSAHARSYVSVFPGEHYRLLASVVDILKPQVVVEVGTFTGLSALAMMATLPMGAQLVTYDLVAWNKIAETALRGSDFVDGRLEQRIGDLTDPTFFDRNREVLSAATLIFLDGPKDGHFEPRLTELLMSLPRERAAILIFDDIRIWKMLAFWRSLALPKLDVTSFGHWLGTGLAYLPIAGDLELTRQPTPPA